MKKITVLLATIILTISAYSQDFTYAAKQSVHSVVYIQCQYKQQATYFDDFFNDDFFNNFFGFQRPQQQQQKTPSYTKTSGSGVIISKDGYIITNNHVVQDADSISVTLNDKREYTAKLVGNDPSADLAVIKIESNDLQPLTYGNSDSVEIGQWVLAVGNPFNLTSTVTAGIVSAKARNINILSSNRSDKNTITSFIQTDAAMNPGNSGGALINTKGELIGINAAIASNTGSYAGYSFAIPVNIVKKVVNDLIKYGVTQRGSMGISIQEVDARLANEKHLKDIKGIYVGSVLKDGAGEKAGIKEGDIILNINGKEVNSNSEVNEVMTQLSPKDVVHLTLLRNNEQMTKDVTLLNANNTTEIVKNEPTNSASAIGATFRDINTNEQQNYSLSKGLVVVKVEKSSPLARGGVRIREGFIITAIDGNVNLSCKEATSYLSKKKGATTIEGFYPKDSRSYYFTVVL